ncbi:uncharacterized protein LOC144863027 [Branchiostoma floridae x Branchiostoma japonicum]
MSSRFSCLLTFLLTFMFLCSAQSVCKPPSDEKCVCSPVLNLNPVMNCGNENAHKAELEQMKIAMDQLSQKIADLSKADANDTEADKPQDCQDILDNDETTPSGVYMVYPRDNLGGFLVFCDMDTDGGGWTLFQKRRDGTVDFYRNWWDYKTGFPSNLNGEFWLGNDNLYRLAVQKVYQLRVDMEDVEGNTAYAAYSTFAISPESQNYKLHIGTYSGTAGDSLSYHDGRPFSTKDRDNDVYSSSCALEYKGAWWYGDCHNSNLNGLYHLGTHEIGAEGVNWKHWKGHYYSLKRTEMKIRSPNSLLVFFPSFESSCPLTRTGSQPPGPRVWPAADANDTEADKPQDCQDILDNDDTTPSGVYMVYPRDNLGGFLVFCDMDTDGGGWTLFQKRQDGTVDFFRGWADYKTGFPSNLNGEFWLGNDNLYRLAVQKVYQLRVDMEDVEGNTAYAAYSTFAISPESQNYKLHIGTYSGNAGKFM